MREYIRRKTSRGWIINLTPEGRTPPAQNAIFNIETPVTIALFLRERGTDEEIPADIRYVALEGTRESKFRQLQSLTLADSRFQPVREGWGDKFSPKPRNDWDSYPAVSDLFLWQSPGIKPNKTWVYAPSRSVLEVRWDELAYEKDRAVMEEKFRETRDSSLYKGKKPLPGEDVEQATQKPLAEAFQESLDWSSLKIVPVAYRSFDRQHLIADSRVLATARPDLWAARIPGQIFVVEQHAHFTQTGPGLYISSLIPDMHCFNNRGGRTHPLYHPDGSANLVKGLLPALEEKLGTEVTAQDLVYYLAAITGHPGYVRTFEENLQEAGIRVPLTADPDLWEQAVSLGSSIVWLHTYGEAGSSLPGLANIREAGQGYRMPVYERAMSREMPEAKPSWESSITIGDRTYEQAMVFGDALWSGLDRRAFDYTVGGKKVIDSWAGYRLKNPQGKRTSPLNDIVQETWPREWSAELHDLLSVLTHLVNLEERQEELLASVLAGPLLFLHDLEEGGVTFPESSRERKPRLG